MGDEASEVPSHDAMPCRSVTAIELLLYVLSNFLLNGELAHRFFGHLNRVLLHLLSHVGRLNDSLVSGSFIVDAHFGLNSFLSVQFC